MSGASSTPLLTRCIVAEETMRHGLYPIRIDASSEDSTARIVDTLLIDPSCLPAPWVPYLPLTPPLPSREGGVGTGGDAISDLVDRNARLMADSVLADAECLPTARSARQHFSGRVELFDRPGLRERVEHQIRSQLRTVLNEAREGGGRTAPPPSPTPERRTGGGSLRTSKRRRVSEGAAESYRGDENENNGREERSEKGDRRLVRIKIRIRENNVVVVDEFDYDASSAPLPGGDAVSIANGIVEDLNLPPKMAAGIALSISEQIRGLGVRGCLRGVETAAHRTGAPGNAAVGGAGAAARRDRPAAWTVDAKEVAASQVRILSDYAPGSG